MYVIASSSLDSSSSSGKTLNSAIRHWVIIPAAGVGKRMQSEIPKQYMSLNGATVIETTISRFITDERFSGVFVGLSSGDPYWSETSYYQHSNVSIYDGGDERVDTVYRGLQVLESRANANDWVWVHDAARPCLSAAEIDDVSQVLNDAVPGALLAVKINDTVKRADADGNAEATVDRSYLWRAMTPQVFRLGELKEALEACQRDGIFVTDDASAMEHIGHRSVLVAGSDQNLKITKPEDLLVAKSNLLKQQGESVFYYPRIGSGFDVHAFESGDFVTIGGVRIPHSHGLKAHSDGDVLLHALADALLGALALGDIGKHFPDTDDQWKGADSRALLRAVLALVKGKGYRVGNVDLTVIAQAPKMAPHISAIQENIAADLETEVSCVGVKATTTEKLGFTGRKEGIAAQASVLLLPAGC